MTVFDRLPAAWLQPGCRWIIGSPPGDWRWCSEPEAAGMSYCPDHAREAGGRSVTNISQVVDKLGEEHKIYGHLDKEPLYHVSHERI